VRILLLPSILELLGRHTWALPAWLEQRLPHLAIEPPETSAAEIEQPAVDEREPAVALR
jgi:putative drug exporter of the RND superfamily